jgi:ubiquinone/menaquinone biosynthesis C-methylase UbiE
MYTIEETNLERQKLLSGMLKPLSVRALSTIHLHESAKILDLGCGIGETTTMLGNQFPGANLTGLDQDPVLIEFARTNHKDNLSTFHFVSGSALDLPFPDNSFDFVFARYLLHHLEDVTTCLKEMKRVCKDGGVVFAQEPDVNFMQTYPESWAFPKFRELVDKLFADAMIGRKLVRYFRESGLRNLEFLIDTLMGINNDPVKKFYAMSADALGKSIIEQNLLDETEFEEWTRECWRLANDPDTILMLYPTIAVWGMK